MRATLVSLLITTLFSLLATVVAGVATASTAGGFAAQARTAGLTAAQATWLQGTVERYLVEVGGTQVAPNQIDLGGKGLLSVALPGEKYPRTFLASSGARQTTGHCLGGANPGYFCAYRGAYGSGDSIAMIACSEYVLPGWTGSGSWDNNQTPGTQARMRGRGGEVLYTTPGAPSHIDSGFDWTPIWGISPC